MSVRSTAILASLLLVALAGRARAHGGVSMENDMCKLRVGSYVMHFTGYQPDSTAEREFCEDIPSTGRTVIVLDYLNDELRDLPVEVRIVRDVGDESNLERITVYHQPPATHGRGSLAVEHNFADPGRFVGLVIVATNPPLVSRFPFSVGTRSTRTWVLYGAFGLGAVGIGAVLFLYSSRQV